MNNNHYFTTNETTLDPNETPVEFRAESVLVIDGPDRYHVPSYVAYRNDTPLGLAIAPYQREWDCMPGYRHDEGYTLIHVPNHRYLHDELYVATPDLNIAKQWLKYTCIVADFSEKRVRIAHDWGETEPVYLNDHYHATTAMLSEFSLMAMKG